MSVESRHRSEPVTGPSCETGRSGASFGPALALTCTIALAVCLLLICVALLIVHPPGSGYLATVVIGQNQRAKTALYIADFAVILPLALALAPRLADRIAAWQGRAGAAALSALAAATFASTLIVAKLLELFSLARGLGVLLACLVVWSAVGATILARAAQPRAWRPLQRLAAHASASYVITALLMLGAILCVTTLSSLSLLGFVLGALAAVAAVLAYGRVSLPKLGRLPGAALDVIAIVLLVLAIPDVVVYTSSSALPNAFFEPGVIQFQQDWILGPTNQLLGGGALLVNVPSSQYGVGLVYFLSAWFHLAPIGYGTFGLLDGILTALTYATGYCVLRIADTGRLLAGAAMSFAVLVLVYNLHFHVGALPEQGPLRFGLPIAVILGAVAAARWPGQARVARAATLVVLGISAVWAVEAFAYTAFTYVALAALESWLEPSGRRRLFMRRLAFGAAACVAAHLILALATLAVTSRLPHWDQYLAFVRSLILGGREGSITYGFADWSPGLALAAVSLISAAAVVLLLTRAGEFARRERVRMTALSGVTAYAIASFSYTDNRSSTYLLLYVALPTVMMVTLWLGLAAGASSSLSWRMRRGGLAFVLSVGVLVLAAAWPSVGAHFSRTALAHAYPGGGLRAALHRLWHPPPIDPRAPEGERLVEAYLQGSHVLVLLPTTPDLAIEILLRARRANALFIGDPSADTFIPSVWMPKVQRQIDSLRPGTHVLTSEDGLRIVTQLRGRSSADAFAHSVAGSATQLQWVLHQLDRRFELRAVARGSSGYVVVQLVARPR